MGVNLRVGAFPAGVEGISLHEVAGPPPSPARLLAAVLPELATRLRALADAGMGPLRREWMEHAAGIGAMVTATSGTGVVRGLAEGIDDDGALLLGTSSGTVRVLAGDVHIVAGGR